MKVLMIHCRKCQKGPLRVLNVEALHPAGSEWIHIHTECMKCKEKQSFDNSEAVHKTVMEHE